MTHSVKNMIEVKEEATSKFSSCTYRACIVYISWTIYIHKTGIQPSKLALSSKGIFITASHLNLYILELIKENI
jgi:hypothetical protein